MSSLEPKRNDNNDSMIPVDSEAKSLRHVSDDIPWTIFLIAITELAERFTNRGISVPMQNYIQNTRDDPFRPGALGLGQGTATAIGYFYMGWTYMAPVLGAIVADSWLGRYWTICLGTGFATCGASVIFATSFPASLDRGAGLPGLLVGIFLLGLGAGGIKSNVAPLIAEQYNRKPMQTRTLKTGERVIINPNLTIQTIYGRYYWIINVGSLSVIPSTWLELKVSFWATFLMPVAFWVFTIIVLALARKVYVVQKPSGSVIIKAARALWVGFKNGRDLDAAKPDRQPDARVQWDSLFIEELKRALVACTVFCIFPIYCVCSGQMSSNLVSQAATMKTYGIPNDMTYCFNPIGIIVFSQIMEKLVYPTLQRFHISFKPISRITAGFVGIGLAFGFTAGIQALIYSSAPCYDHPLRGSCSEGGTKPNNVSVFFQIATHSIIAIAEILAYVSGMEYAYTKAPKSMRSIVSSIFLFSETAGAVLGIAFAPVSKDPQVLVLYASLAGVSVVTAGFFLAVFAKYDKVEERMNMLDDRGE